MGDTALPVHLDAPAAAAESAAEQVHSRGSTIRRLFSHDAYHSGERSQTLGIHRLPQIDLASRMTAPDPPNPESTTQYIVETFPGVDVATSGGGRFFSLDPEKHWPNFATLVTTDEFDDASTLSRPGVFRLNIGVNRSTFERLVGSERELDYTVLDRLLPHPVYARQHWVSVLNPSQATFETIVKPLLAEAHDRLAAQRARHPRRS